MAYVYELLSLKIYMPFLIYKFTQQYIMFIIQLGLFIIFIFVIGLFYSEVFVKHRK